MNYNVYYKEMDNHSGNVHLPKTENVKSKQHFTCIIVTGDPLEETENYNPAT